MTTLPLAPDAQATLDKFLSFWPLMSRSHQQDKVLRAAEYQMLKQGAVEVSRDMLMIAIEQQFPAFETFVLGLKDPARIQQVVAAQKQIDHTNPLARITRWQLPAVPIERPVNDVLALLTGPRVGGNTDVIMDSVLAGVRETGATVEKLCISQLKINTCCGCLKCQSDKPDTRCAIRDDMTHIYQRLLECDAFVLGFPIYSGRESCHTTIFFDRLKALSDPYAPIKFTPKKGALISTWGWPSPMLYQDVVHNIAFLIRHFGVETAEVVTGCGYWDAYYPKGTALLDNQGIVAARSAGRALCAGTS